MNVEERTVMAGPISVCANGHVEFIGEAKPTVQIRHPRCGEWTWKDANYCVRCGGRLQTTEAKR